MVIKLFMDPVSQPSRAVLALCKIASIPHQVIPTFLMKGANHTPEFAQINPMKKVPAILDTDNGLALAQSHSILKYLVQKFNIGEQWYPRQDLVKQAKINQFLDFHHHSTRRCSYLVFHIVIAPTVTFGDPTFNRKYTEKVVKTNLKSLEDIYLKDKRFVGGEQPCIGDLIGFYDVTMLEVIDYDYTPFPKIVSWIKEMRKIAGVVEADSLFQKSKQKLNERFKASAKL